MGTLISTFWILASISWMQTSQDRGWPRRLEVDFEPLTGTTFPFRLAHMAIAAFVVGALVAKIVDPVPTGLRLI